MKDLTIGKERDILIKFALPMIMGNLFQQTYAIFDSIIVGKLIGGKALAAVGASFPIIFALISFVIGIATAGNIIISQFYGSKNIEKVRSAIDTIFVFIFFASIIIMVIGFVFSKRIFILTRLSDEVIPQAMIYLKTVLSGTILLFGFNGISAILKGVGDSKTPLYFQVFAAVLNIILDIIFILVFKLGILGPALATVVAQGTTFILAAVYLNRTHKVVKIKFRHISFDKDIFRHSVRIGLPSGFQQTFVALGMIALYRIVNNFGTNVTAAYSVAGRIDSLTMVPSMIFGQALSTFVGQNLGAGKIGRIKKGLNSTLVISIIISIFTSLLIIVLKKPMMSLFSNNDEIIEIGSQYLLVVSSCYIVYGIMSALNGIMRGAGDTFIPMLNTLISLWIIRIPLAAFLSHRYHELGIWIAIPMAWSFGSIFSYFYYKTGNWKKKVIIKSHDSNI